MQPHKGDQGIMWITLRWTVTRRCTRVATKKRASPAFRYL